MCSLNAQNVGEIRKKISNCIIFKYLFIHDDDPFLFDVVFLHGENCTFSNDPVITKDNREYKIRDNFFFFSKKISERDAIPTFVRICS